MKCYVIDIALLNKTSEFNPFMDDAEFIQISEKQGNALTLEGFQYLFNMGHLAKSQGDYGIRFI